MISLIKSVDDNHLRWSCETSAISAMDSLKMFDFNSTVWKIHISGLSYGIWISCCDPNYITLDDINDIIESYIMSSMN